MPFSCISTRCLKDNLTNCIKFADISPTDEKDFAKAIQSLDEKAVQAENLEQENIPGAEMNTNTVMEEVKECEYSYSLKDDDEESYEPSEGSVFKESKEKHKNAKKNRWSKKNDVFLFNTIKNMQDDGRLPLNFLDSFSSRKSKFQRSELNILAYAVGWIGPIPSLINRIRLLHQRNTSMSVRDCKFLRKIIRREYAEKPIDYEKLSKSFPGKSIDVLKATYLKMFKKATDPDAATILTTRIVCFTKK